MRGTFAILGIATFWMTALSAETKELSPEAAIHCIKPTALGVFEQCERVQILNTFKKAGSHSALVRIYSALKQSVKMVPSHEIFEINQGNGNAIKSSDPVLVGLGTHYQICRVQTQSPLLFNCGSSLHFNDQNISWMKLIPKDLATRLSKKF
jgi:hypothetical protein